MTREHKLALIVGFSLVLLVGVLIADHLSLARRVQIAPVGEQELIVARGPAQLAADPLQLIQMPEQQSPPAPAIPEATLAQRDVPPLMPEFTPEPATEPASGPTAAGVSDPLALVLGGGGTTPVEPARTPEQTPTPQDALARQIAEAGGTIEGGTIRLPLAGQTSPVARQERAETPKPEPNKPGNRNLAVGPEAAAAAPDKGYTVKKGDTYFKIAERQYGDGSLWRKLATYNGSKDGTVYLGDTIRLPAKDGLTGKPTVASKPGADAPPSRTPPKKADPAPARPSRTELAATYTVKKGDTLGDISLKVLGTSKRWREIAEYNKIKDADLVTAGTVLKVPPMRG